MTLVTNLHFLSLSLYSPPPLFFPPFFCVLSFSITEKQSSNTWWVFNKSNISFASFISVWITLCVCSSGKPRGSECSAHQQLCSCWITQVNLGSYWKKQISSGKGKLHGVLLYDLCSQEKKYAFGMKRWHDESFGAVFLWDSRGHNRVLCMHLICMFPKQSITVFLIPAWCSAACRDQLVYAHSFLFL